MSGALSRFNIRAKPIVVFAPALRGMTGSGLFAADRRNRVDKAA